MRLTGKGGGHVKHILFRKLWRTMGVYKAQFISMIIMITLGIGIFFGFNMEWYSIEQDTSRFFTETGFADYRIIMETGCSASDLEAIEALDGVEAASRYLSVNVDVADHDTDTVALSVTENAAVSAFLVNEGEAYDAESSDGIWLSQKYAAANDIAVGDDLTLSYTGLKVKGTVKGLIQSSEYMICVRDETQLMPDFETHGYAYISPAMFKKVIGIAYYPQIHVISDLPKDAFTDAVNEALGITALILTKNEVVSYAQAMGEAEEGKIMGSILPVVFLLIAILTMVTTMHRLTMKERIQIGTLKALGFKDKQILRHYTSYALLIGIGGSILGLVLGYFVAGLIMNENGMMGTYLDLPYWQLHIPAFCWLIEALILLLLTLVGRLSVRRLLQGNAADTLRQDVSEKQRRLKVEKTAWFHRLSFGTRWNMRDIARHRSRTAMSLIGVTGCTIIIIAVLGMQDTMDAFLDTYYNEAMQYESRIYLSDDISDKQLAELMQTYGSDVSSSISVQLEDKAVSLDIYSLPDGMIRFPGEKNGYIELPDDGAYICRRIADANHLRAGDTISVSPFGSDDTYELTVAGISRSVTESILLSEAYADALGIEHTPDSLYTSAVKEDIETGDGIQTVQSKQMIMDSFDSFMEILNTMVAVLILAGIVLGIVVLYNLGIMSYTERYREMATLKVLGFKDRKIGSLLISQNMWISIAGVILGLPLGYGVLSYLLDAMATEYELVTKVQLSSYLLTIGLTFGMSLLVSFMVSRKNRHIDMVEALKSAE